MVRIPHEPTIMRDVPKWDFHNPTSCWHESCRFFWGWRRQFRSCQDYMGAHEAKQMILEQEQMLQAEAVQVSLAPTIFETHWILLEWFFPFQYPYDHYVSRRKTLDLHWFTRWKTADFKHSLRGINLSGIWQLTFAASQARRCAWKEHPRLATLQCGA